MQDCLFALACGLHERMGESSPFRSIQSDMLCEIVRHIPIVVPDDVRTLKDAMDLGLPGQRILVRRGEHVVGASTRYEEDAEVTAGPTILDIHQPVHIEGEAGVILRGMLRMLPTSLGGSISAVTIHDSGAEACIKAEGGTWVLNRCFLLSGHAAAIRAEGAARVVAVACRLGGEGAIGRAVPEYYELPRTWIDTAGSVQEYGLRKHSCYGIFVRDEAEVAAEACEVSFCSESAVFMRDRGQVVLRQARLADSVTAFTSGLGLGAALKVTDSQVVRCRHLWFDEDRPPSLVWTGCEVSGIHDSDSRVASGQAVAVA